MNIYEKLMNIQAELKAPKSQYNNFGKYAYRNCEDILEALKPLLQKNKCTLVITDQIEKIDTRFYVKATVKIFDTESEGFVENTAYAREEDNKKGMDGSQVTGASSSYARKYALNGMFAIDDTKDSDYTNTNGKGDNNAQGLTDAQIKRLLAIGNKAGVNETIIKNAVAHDYGIQDLKKLTKNQYNDLCERLEKKANNQ